MADINLDGKLDGISGLGASVKWHDMKPAFQSPAAATLNFNDDFSSGVTNLNVIENNMSFQLNNITAGEQTLNITAITDANGCIIPVDLSGDFIALNGDAEIDIQGNGLSIANQDNTPQIEDGTAFEAIPFNTTISHTFSIKNLGTAALALSGTPVVEIDNTTDFSLVQPTANTIEADGTLDFEVTFMSIDETARTATISLMSDDCDETLYRFQIRGTGASPLAIEQLQFTAQAVEHRSLLEWRVVHEANVDKYFIEWYNGHHSWEDIGFVSANHHQSYNFWHEKPTLGVNYYRLRQLDENGKVDYSPLRTVYFGEGANHLHIYPNPTTGKLLIVLPDIEKKEGQIRIYDALGRKLNQLPLQDTGQQELSIEHLQAGIYWVEVFIDNVALREKVIKI